MKRFATTADDAGKEGKLQKFRFYVCLMALGGPLMEAFDAMTQRPSFEHSAHELAKRWRNDIRPECEDPLVCRQRIAACTLCELLKRGELNKPGLYQLAVAIALAMADRTEEIVLELDRAEKHGSN